MNLLLSRRLLWIPPKQLETMGSKTENETPFFGPHKSAAFHWRKPKVHRNMMPAVTHCECNFCSSQAHWGSQNAGRKMEHGWWNYEEGKAQLQPWRTWSSITSAWYWTASSFLQKYETLSRERMEAFAKEKEAYTSRLTPQQKEALAELSLDKKLRVSKKKLHEVRERLHTCWSFDKDWVGTYAPRISREESGHV